MSLKFIKSGPARKKYNLSQNKWNGLCADPTFPQARQLGGCGYRYFIEAELEDYFARQPIFKGSQETARRSANATAVRIAKRAERAKPSRRRRAAEARSGA